jgi:Domain of unknown function (DUF4328)
MQSRPLPEQGPTRQGASSGWGAEETAYRPLDWPARAVEFLLAVYLVVTVVAVAFDWLELNLWTRLLHDPVSLLEAHPTSINGRQALAQVLQSCAYLLTGVGFLVWFHRAYTNLIALGREPLPYSPGWAIGAWLVPFLNLVRPKRMMDIVWRGSDPDRPWPDGFWRNRPVHALVHWWWAVFVGSWVVDRVLAALLHQGLRSEFALEVISVRTFFSDSLGLLLGVLCFEVVRRATRRQRGRAAAQPAVAPPG